MIYYFNPDAEMALREGEASYYIAPAAVRQMAHDLALLPLWLGGEGDNVLVEEWPPSEFIEQLHTLFPFLKLPSIILPQQLEPNLPFTPWGWNPTLFAKLRHRGLSYPDEEAAAPLRYALGNKTNLEQLDRKLMSLGLSSARQRHFSIHSVSEAEALLAREARLFSHGFLLKEGYSSSGRGHRWCRPTSANRQADNHSQQTQHIANQQATNPQQLLTAEVRQWITRRTERGEAIDMEPIYDKVADLALLFHLSPYDKAGSTNHKTSITSCKANFTGYSLFQTSAEGAYRGNLLASNEAILNHLSQLIDTSLIVEAKQTFIRLLEEQYPTLSGPIGIDMMIYRDAESNHLSLHPNVEINPRPTMGLIARCLYDRLLAHHAPNHESLLSAWRFVVEGSSSATQLQERHKTDLQHHPLRCDANDHPTEGYLPLIPIGPNSRFRAYIIK